MLSGYKTYIIGTVAIIGAAGAYLAGDATLTDALQIAVPALLGMFIRHGVASGA